MPDFLIIPHLGHTALAVVDIRVASEGDTVPGRTDMGHGLLIQRRNGHIQDIIHIKKFPPATAANGMMSGMFIAIGVFVAATVRGHCIGNGWNSARACRQASIRDGRSYKGGLMKDVGLVVRYQLTCLHIETK